MNAVLSAAAVASLVLPIGVSGQVDRVTGAPQAPTQIADLFTCSYVDDNDLEDLLQVIAKWNAWADGHGITDYSAFVMTPWRMPDRGVDTGWFGVWSSGAAMGRGVALWLAEGGDLQAEFEAVVDCAASRQFVAIDAVMPGGPPPETSVMGLRNCWVREGRTTRDVLAGMDRWADYLAERGHAGSQGLLLRFAGSMLEADFDFKAIEGFGAPELYGDFVDLYATGGRQRADAIFGSLMECDNRRLYLMHQVRVAAPAR